MAKKPPLFLVVALSLLCLISAFFLFLNASRKNTAPPVPTPTPPPQNPQLSLVVAGDVMLARSVTTKMRQLQDFSYPFAKIAPVLANADLTLVNLESPFGRHCPSTDQGMKFCADFRSLEGLIKAGVDLVSLANNHALDQGEAGLSETIRLLEENFITPIGLREPVFLKVKGINLVFLAYNGVLPKSELISWSYPEVITSEIKRFKKEADLLIVFFHWGKEYQKAPMAGSGTIYDPKKLARRAIDAGADLILGAHPHIVQETEWYRDSLIVYSLGNLVFDQSWSQATQEGLIGRFILDKNGLISHQLLPIQIKNYQPKLKSSAS
jgi:poly-gamma-glutamate synthesis protein (capsule biosynthesis protein)